MLLTLMAFMFNAPLIGIIVLILAIIVISMPLTIIMFKYVITPIIKKLWKKAICGPDPSEGFSHTPACKACKACK